MNRLTAANFVQNTSGTSWDFGYIDFTIGNLTYDANGNILSMNQKGFKVGGSQLIDQLAYTYQANSNKLSQVNDASNDPLSKLGDFHYTGSKGSSDYTYDGNGNLITDNNKLIDNIIYNYLNLPSLVHPNSKGNIVYVYDAGGNKLEKITSDSTSRHTTTTLYISGFIYQQTDTITNPTGGIDTLQFIGQEEGRVRWAYHKYTTGYSAYGFEYDFFEKDHLGNTRMVLTQQKDTAKYLASGEAAYRATESQLFANLTTTTIARTAAPGYPVDLTITNPNDTVFKVNGNVGGHKIGPSLLLKVMSGDKIDIAVQSYYNTGTTSTPNSSITDVLASLATGVVNMTSGGKGSITDLNNTSSSPIYAALNSFLPTDDPTPSGKPKAYLNWILLDDQLKYVSSYPQSGAVAVTTAGTLNTLGYTGLPITKNGFLYIWISNETPNWDAFFDNLVVKQYSGPLLEENHYYPFGLAMAAITSKALKPFYAENKYRYNGKELQNKEFSDGTGLEDYDYGARMYDLQIGRWMKIDKKTELYFGTSPYVYSLNQPTNAIDPDGNLVIFINGNHFGDGGEPRYWRREEKTNYNSVTHRNGAAHYEEYAFDKQMMNALHDQNENWNKTSLDTYKDGGLGGWGRATNVGQRYLAGYSEGEADAETIISNLARDKNGNIIESIKIVAHSMGAAFAKGYIAAIIEYVKKHPEECNGLTITEYDIAAYQPGQQGKRKGATLNQFVNDQDGVNTSIILGSSNDKEDGADTYNENTGEGGHSIFDFKWILKLINDLPTGNFVWDSKKHAFVPSSTPTPKK